MLNHSFPQFSVLVTTVGGISVYTSDVYFISLCLIMILSHDGSKLYISQKHILFYLYVLAVIASMIQGALSNGFCSDLIGDIRKFSTIFITALYYLHHPVVMDDAKMRVLTITMRGTLIFCWVCWASALVLGVYLTPNGTLRCIGSNYAFILSIYTVWLFYRDLILSKKRRIKFETLIYIVTIIILQHNTVYMTLAVGILTLLWVKRKELFVKHNMWIFQIVVISVIGIFVLSLVPNSPLTEMITSTMDKFSQAVSISSGSEEGTMGTRYIVWKGLIDTLNTPFDWLFGKSMGTGYRVQYLSGIWQVSPHSGYIEGLMRVGLLGMICLLGQILYNFIVHIKREEALCASFLVMILVYWYSYSYTSEIGFLLGMSMAIVGNIIDLNRGEKLYYEDEVEEVRKFNN